MHRVLPPPSRAPQFAPRFICESQAVSYLLIFVPKEYKCRATNDFSQVGQKRCNHTPQRYGQDLVARFSLFLSTFSCHSEGKYDSFSLFCAFEAFCCGLYFQTLPQSFPQNFFILLCSSLLWVSPQFYRWSSVSVYFFSLSVPFSDRRP
jgi:hypothetical protein